MIKIDNIENLYFQVEKYFAPNQDLINILSDLDRVIEMNFYSSLEWMSDSIKFNLDLDEITNFINSIRERKGLTGYRNLDLENYSNYIVGDAKIIIEGRTLNIESTAMMHQLLKFLNSFYGSKTTEFGNKPKSEKVIQREILSLIYSNINYNLKWVDCYSGDDYYQKRCIKILFDFYVNHSAKLSDIISRQVFSQYYDKIVNSVKQ